jgi:hypothetical protein
MRGANAVAQQHYNASQRGWNNPSNGQYRETLRWAKFRMITEKFIREPEAQNCFAWTAGYSRK